MKNIIKYIAIFSCVFFTISCLDQDPIDQIGERDFYKTTEDLNQAVTACYNGLQKSMENEWALTELRSDNSRFYGANSSATQSKEQYGLNNFRFATSNTYNQKYWEATYHNIANCNTVFKHIGVVTDETTRKQFEGEAAFLRAYHYFNLVRLYGPLFLVTERISMDQANKSERSSVEDVYKLITGDLEDIITNEKLPKSYQPADKGRVDIWAAKALLAKVYLTLGRLQDARQLLIQFTDPALNCPYKLLTTGANPYASVFSIDNEMSEEIIFTVRYKGGGVGLGAPFANLFAPASSYDLIIKIGGSSGFNCPTDNLRKSYEPLDKRKDVSLADSWVNPVGVTVNTAYCKKYLSQVQTRYDAENDWPVIRFADILLMLGEIENELTGPAAGLPYINQTRVRAGLNPLILADIPNKHTFRMAIEKERRLEFAFENHRFFDLVRTNRLIPVMKEHYDTETIANTSGSLTPYYGTPNTLSYLEPGSRTLQNWQLLLPVPFNVILVAKKATQNPGY